MVLQMYGFSFKQGDPVLFFSLPFFLFPNDLFFFAKSALVLLKTVSSLSRGLCYPQSSLGIWFPSFSNYLNVFCSCDGCCPGDEGRHNTVSSEAKNNLASPRLGLLVSRYFSLHLKAPLSPFLQ